MAKYNTDPEFISELAQRLNIKPDYAKEITKAFTDSVRNLIVTNGILNVRGLGFFHTRTRKGGIARNPHTGQEMKIAVMMRIIFRPSHSLKQAVNERAKRVRKEQIGF